MQFNAGEILTMEHFGNEFTTPFCVTDAANSGQSMNDTNVFVLLIRWVYLEEMECRVQMGGGTWQYRSTVAALAWYNIYAISKCDITSYSYVKAKANALMQTLHTDDFLG